MANKRMFAKSITNSSQFLMMPQSSQNLYFHLGMNADDDGFCEHFTIMRMTESKPDDLKLLHAKNFVEIFDDKVLIIIDWKENNYIRSDRYTSSKYLEVYKDKIELLFNGIPSGIPKTDTDQYRLDQYSIDKNRSDKINEEKKEKESLLEDQVNKCYKLYPSKCLLKNRSTNKSGKDKSSLKQLIKKRGFGGVYGIIERRLANKLNAKEWLPNFCTFLNTFPESINDIPLINKIDSGLDANGETIHKQVDHL